MRVNSTISLFCNAQISGQGRYRVGFMGDPDVGQVKDLTMGLWDHVGLWLGQLTKDILKLSNRYITLKLERPLSNLFSFQVVLEHHSQFPKKNTFNGLALAVKSGNRFPSPYSLHVPSTCGLIHIESFLMV